MIIPIVIIAYNRPNSLRRLLSALSVAHYAGNEVELIISIDATEVVEVYEIADRFEWRFGKKNVIKNKERKGLKEHVITCGDLSNSYDGVIVLEDDLYVSPDFYKYSLQAAEFYKNVNNVAGISLYSYAYNEFSNLPFYPLYDGYDNYFMQVPSSWGQLWLKEWWSDFKEFIQSELSVVTSEDKLPDMVLKYWENDKSWKKVFFKYLLLKNKYFVYPRVSFSTNFTDFGANVSRGMNHYQVPLANGFSTLKLSKLQESNSIYDSSFEIIAELLKRYNCLLKNYDFEVDLHGDKPLNKIDKPYLLSVKSCSKTILGFDNSLMPQELNMIYNMAGSFFVLGKTEDFGVKIKQKYIDQLTSYIKADLSPIFIAGRNIAMQSTRYRLGKLLLHPLDKILRRH